MVTCSFLHPESDAAGKMSHVPDVHIQKEMEEGEVHPGPRREPESIVTVETEIHKLPGVIWVGRVILQIEGGSLVRHPAIDRQYRKVLARVDPHRVSLEINHVPS